MIFKCYESWSWLLMSKINHRECNIKLYLQREIAGKGRQGRYQDLLDYGCWPHHTFQSHPDPAGIETDKWHKIGEDAQLFLAVISCR